MIKKIFSRVSPEKFQEYMIQQLGWIVIPWKLIEDGTNRRKLHGKWVKITSQHGSIYRVISFHGNLKGNIEEDPADIVIDWVGWVRLHGYKENVNPPIELKITKAGFVDKVIAYFNHPEPFNRLTSWVSLAFTIIGIIIGYILSELS